MRRVHWSIQGAVAAVVVLSWFQWGGCGGSDSRFCHWETVSNTNADAFVPWWDLDGGGGDGACATANACGGCSVLAVEPGTPCGACGGEFVCDGPDAVRCEDPCEQQMGCSDGEREALTDATAFPDIAGCAGAWSESGILDVEPSCSRLSGDDSINPSGLGCSPEDLCAKGWHVCASPEEVDAAMGGNGCGTDWPPDSFFAVAMSANNDGDCDPDGTNDLFGCGSAGGGAPASCAPLDRSSGDKCEDLPGTWECPGGLFGSSTEGDDVKKSGPAGGGVLCCRDPAGP